MSGINRSLPARPPKKGLKVDNTASMINKPAPSHTEEFEKNASAAFSKDQEYKNRFWELSVKIKAMIEDTVLSDNKSSISKDLEKETATKLVMLASEMDDDVDQPNCEGTRGMTMLLMKCLLIQRDTINSLSYKLSKLEKQEPGK